MDLMGSTTSGRLRAAFVNAAYRAVDLSGLNRLMAGYSKRSLRILVYHGICRDEECREAWVPPSFVSYREFAFQMQYLRSRFRVTSLRAALEGLRTHGSFEPGAAAVTFDDGYENNLSIALPVLKQYAIPATIFVCTRWVAEGELFPHDKVRLLRLWCPEEASPLTAPHSRAHRDLPIQVVLQELDRLWPKYRHRLTGAQREALRPMSWEQIRSVDASLIEIGAHTHQHAILAHERAGARQEEDRKSTRLNSSHLGVPAPLFAYPNGIDRKSVVYGNR